MPRRIALAIGISKAPPLDYLRGAVNGAQEFAEWATKNSYETELLTDQTTLVTIESLYNKLHALLATHSEDPIARMAIYFAGHGLIRGAEDGLWLLSDWYDKMRAVAFEALKRRLCRYYGISQVAIFSDACRSLPTNVDTMELTGDAVLGRGPEKEAQQPRVDKFIATQDAAKTFMVPGLTEKDDRCLFSGVLMEGLWGAPAAISTDTPGKVTSSSLADFLELEVPRRALTYRRKLSPTVQPNFRRGDDIYFGDVQPLPVAPIFTPWTDPKLIIDMGLAVENIRFSQLIIGDIRTISITKEFSGGSSELFQKGTRKRPNQEDGGVPGEETVEYPGHGSPDDIIDDEYVDLSDNATENPFGGVSQDDTDAEYVEQFGEEHSNEVVEFTEDFEDLQETDLSCVLEDGSPGKPASVKFPDPPPTAEPSLAATPRPAARRQDSGDILRDSLSGIEIPGYFDTGSGFAVDGREPRSIWLASGHRLVQQPQNPHWLGVSQDGAYWLPRPTPVLIELEGGNFLAQTAFPDFVASALCTDNGVQALIYRESYGDKSTGALALDAIARMESGALRAADIPDLSIELRTEKHADPVLGVISAYLYDSIEDVDSIRRMAWFYVRHHQPIPYDIALLAQVPGRRNAEGILEVDIPALSSREPRTEKEAATRWACLPTDAATGTVAGFWPWMKQGWPFLDDPLDVELGLVHPALPALQRHLSAARFTTINREGAQALAAIMNLQPTYLK